jgi:hypothetical protein
MPNYDILYLNADGTVAAKLNAHCASDREASILAHAMKARGFARIKVLSDEGSRHLVYQRPLSSASPSKRAWGE